MKTSPGAAPAAACLRASVWNSPRQVEGSSPSGTPRTPTGLGSTLERGPWWRCGSGLLEVAEFGDAADVDLYVGAFEALDEPLGPGEGVGQGVDLDDDEAG